MSNEARTETAILARHAETRSAAAIGETIRRAREANPICSKCHVKRARTWRYVEQHSLCVGLCPDCEGSNGLDTARGVATIGRRMLDQCVAALERATSRV